MSKKYLTISLCFLLVQIYVFAQDNFKPGSEPAGFRGIEWGTDINTIGDMEFIPSWGKQKTYRKKNDVLKFEGVDLKKIEYTFIDEKLWSVKAVVSESNYDAFKKAIFKKYGKAKPYHSFEENGTRYRQYRYEGELTNMVLGVNTFRKVRYLAFTQSENNISKWKTYRNEKYGYEIKYPVHLESGLIGRKKDRDGKNFRIFVPQIAVFHGLDVTLYPGKKMAEIAALDHRFNDFEKKFNDFENWHEYVNPRPFYMIQTHFKVKIDGREVMKIGQPSTESKKLIGAVYILDGVKFNFSGGGSLPVSLADKIISTFKFYK